MHWGGGNPRQGEGMGNEAIMKVTMRKVKQEKREVISIPGGGGGIVNPKVD